MSEVPQKHFQSKFINIAIYCNTLFDIAIYRNTFFGPQYPVWLVVLRIYVASAVFQPYRDLEAGDDQSLKCKRRGGESNPGPLAPQATAAPDLKCLINNIKLGRFFRKHNFKPLIFANITSLLIKYLLFH